jgi:prevent-host-death family protein
MRSVPIREAKAKFSELVDAVEAGEQVTIMRHGEPAAVLVSVEDANQILRQRRSVADVLLSVPDGIPLERDQTPIRDVDL